jgi:hypothetical protein
LTVKNEIRTHGEMLSNEIHLLNETIDSLERILFGEAIASGRSRDELEARAQQLVDLNESLIDRSKFGELIKSEGNRYWIAASLQTSAEEFAKQFGRICTVALVRPRAYVYIIEVEENG